jgi:hypothetical protein
MKVQWQTGRFYTEQGQRMVAQTSGKYIQFTDLDRGINGVIPLATDHCIDSKYDLREVTMFNYDRNNYVCSQLTLEWEPA